MIVTIKFIAGQEIDLEVESDYTISSLKELVARQFDVPVEQQRLVFKVLVFSEMKQTISFHFCAPSSL